MPRPVFLQYKLHHILFWMLAFGTWYFLRYQDYGSGSMALKVTAIKIADLAALVYITNYLLIPRLLYRKKYLVFAIVYVLMILVSSITKMYILSGLMNLPSQLTIPGDLKTRIYDNVIPHFFLVTAGAAIRLMIDYFRLQQRMMETAKENAEAELNFLKSQINPHFLFNSINSVYFLIDKQNNEARESLHKFSDMLRYQLYEVNGSRVPIEKEIRYLQDYVHLQKLRKDEQYEVSFSFPAAPTGFSIEPLLLIPFVENAFKHVSAHNNQPNFIRIHLSFSEDELLFTTENSRETKTRTDGYGGIGLKNVKRRLELLYSGQYDLQIRETDTVYTVSLKLKTDKTAIVHSNPTSRI